jgi:hypothetical protein
VAASFGISVELADGLDYLERMPEESVGAIVILDVLEHLEDDQLVKWLEAAQRRLDVGGVLVARVPNGEGLFFGAIRYGDLTHRRAFTTQSLRQALGPAGFQEIAFRPCRPVPHGIPSLMRSGAWIVVETILRFVNFAESGQWRGAIFTRNVVVVARKPPRPITTEHFG